MVSVSENPSSVPPLNTCAFNPRSQLILGIKNQALDFPSEFNVLHNCSHLLSLRALHFCSSYTTDQALSHINFLL